MSITIPDFSKARVLVVGDVMLDRYWYGATSRISPEAPVPVVKVNHVEDRPGGAANVALNIAALEAKVGLLGIVGEDETAKALETLLDSAHITCHFLNNGDIPTITKLRVMSQHQQLIRMDFEENLYSDLSHQLLSQFQSIVKDYDVVILSDYGKGTLNDSVNLIETAQKAKVPVFVDPKGKDFSKYQNATCITPNMNEFQLVAGSVKDEKDLIEKAQELMRDCHLESLLVTRGERGMTFFRPDQEELHLPTQAKEVFDVTGAGDTVISMMAIAKSLDLSDMDSIKLANSAAGIVVGKLGSATASLPELYAAFSALPEGGVVNVDQMKLIMAHLKAQGKKVVMTNGCFDILHAGHVRYLEEAKKLGDYLIVAVNSDASVKRLKGEGRPINGIEKRMAVLAGLASVDFVLLFEEDTPEALIDQLIPNILVKGGDWEVCQIAGSKTVLAHGGEVKSLSFLEGHSTTSVIEKIRED